MNLCNEVVVAVEPHPVTVSRTKFLLEDLNEKGFGKSRLITTVLINRIRSDVQLTWTQVQETLEQPVANIISPSPEMAYQAAIRYNPIILLQPDGLISQQYGNVAASLAQHIHKRN